MNDAIRSVTDAPFNPSGRSVQTGDPNALGKDAFMKLLVTQLANQDPMSPADPTQFVSQLAQFTSLEQLVSVNDGLNVLALSQAASTSAQMVSFVGKEVWVDDSSAFLSGGGEPVDLHFGLDADATKVDIAVKDSTGKVVRTIEAGAHEAGDVVVSFDGLDDDGNPLPAGMYTFDVGAQDGSGADIGVTERSSGTVASVTFDAGYPQLLLEDGIGREVTGKRKDGRTVALGLVLEDTSGGASTPAAAAAAAAGATSDGSSGQTDSSAGLDPQEIIEEAVRRQEGTP